MENHVSVVSILHIIAGVLGLVGGLIVSLIFGVATLAIGINAPLESSMIAIPIVAGIGFMIVILSALCPILGIIAGFGLQNRARWARILCVVVSILYFPVYFPLGASLGVYSLWVMFSKETEILFQIH